MGFGLKEAIEHIQKTTPDAMRPYTFREESMPEDQFYLWAPGWEGPRLVTSEPAPRRYWATTIDGFVQQVNHFADEMRGNLAEGEWFGPLGPVCVFVGSGRLTALLGEYKRRDMVVMELTKTDGFDDLMNGGYNGVRQKQLVWDLRSKFGSQVEPGHFLPDIKALKFRSSSDGESAVAVGRESLGRAVIAEAMGASGDLPEEITLRVKVYKELPDDIAGVRIRCAFDVDLAEQKFYIKPMPGEVETAQRVVDKAIADAVRFGVGSDRDVRVFECSMAAGYA